MRDSFVFYRSFYEALKGMDKNVQADCLMALAQYALDGDMPALTPEVRMFMTLAKPQIDANNQKFVNGSKGGRPKRINNQTETKTEPENNQEITEPKPNDNQTETKTEPENNQEITEPKPNDNQTETKTEPENNQEITEPKPNDNQTETKTEPKENQTETGIKQKEKNKNTPLNPQEEKNKIYPPLTPKGVVPQNKKSPKKISFSDVLDWESLFDYWESWKKGGRYKNAESRSRMLAKLKELTGNDFDLAKRAICHCVDSGYQGFANGAELFYKPSKAPPGREQARQAALAKEREFLSQFDPNEEF